MSRQKKFNAICLSLDRLSVSVIRPRRVGTGADAQCYFFLFFTPVSNTYAGCYNQLKLALCGWTGRELIGETIEI